MLCDEAVHEALDDAYDWSFAGERRIKGIDGRVKLYRLPPRRRQTTH